MAGYQPRHLRPKERSPHRLRAATLLVTGTAMCAFSLPALAQALTPPAPPHAAERPAKATSADPFPPTPIVLTPAVAAPVRLIIPAIGVTTSLARLGVQSDGTLEDLKDFDRPGWYSGGIAPGSPGAALIAGHVDSYRGPAVFYKLERLGAGDLVSIQRADGSVVQFVVDRLASYPKNNFPTDQVFSATTPQLRLITCFGSFDPVRKSYTRNLVVYASLRTPVQPGAQSRPRTALHPKELS